jgi:deoxyribodipyrimidine photo-lyase
MSSLCWIRRDLRLHDHAALSKALSDGETTLVFIFDSYILEKLKNKQDRRVTFIYQSLVAIEKELAKKGSSLVVAYGKPEIEIPKLAAQLKVATVYSNRDYEPYAKERDQKVKAALKKIDVEFDQFKDSVFYEKEEIKKGDGGLYKVFTPYKNKWLETFEHQAKTISDYECDLKHLRKFSNPESILTFDWYEKIGFEETLPLLPGGTKEAFKRLEAFNDHLKDYTEARNFPSLPGTSLLSVYIRHGNLSVRDMLRAGVHSRSEGAKTWVSEIIWRDFYQMILDAYPHIVDGAFKPQYDKIKFPGGNKEFKAWSEGRTGFPLVDAAMRCLNETGMMHNRLRMVVASLLCKILLVHWQKGESYFAEHLLDFDLAANNGGWQWSSSSGCDAQPYFRIFNPYAQSEKFDPKGEFIRKWVPELAHLPPKNIHRPTEELAPDYPRPIVSYELNRRRCLDIYSVVKN